MVTARPIDFQKRRFRIARFIGARSYLGVYGRIAWLGVAAVCLGVLGLSATLRPDPRGHGTHEALGMPPCGFMLMSGLPCPTCGMTTAFSLAMHGRPWDAFIAQPAGAVLCAGTILMLFVSLHAALRGCLLTPNWDRIGPARVMLIAGFLLLAGWAFKIAHGLFTGALPAR